MKIAIFGGTFDPPHNEHRSIAEHVLSELKPDRLIVMPAKLPPHKRREGVSRAKDRAEMAKLAFSGLDGVEFSDFEMRQRGPSYTYRTLQYFHKRYPGDELVFVIGSDSLRDFFSWRSPKKIAELATIAVCRRRGAGSLARAVKTFEKRTGKSPILLDYAGADLSSPSSRCSSPTASTSRVGCPKRCSGLSEKNGCIGSETPLFRAQRSF